jgi:hypothetical protein
VTPGRRLPANESAERLREQEIVVGSFSIWHWLVVVLVVAVPVGLIVWLTQRNKRRTAGQLKGFGGWLILLAIGTWLAPFRTLAAMSHLMDGVDSAVVSRLWLAFSGEFVLFGGLEALEISLIVLMTRKSWRFPSMFVWTAIYSIALFPVDFLWSSTVISIETGATFGSVLNPDIKMIGQWIVLSLVLALWMSYVTLSKRVANTFVRHRKSIPGIDGAMA